MTHWTSYDFQASGVRPCTIVDRYGTKAHIALTHEGGNIWVMSHYVFDTAEGAIADAKARRDKMARQHIAYWQRVLERDIGVAS
jgi:hypothetical protein